MFSHKLLFIILLLTLFTSPQKVESFKKERSSFEVPQDLYFHVYRNSTKIGHHSVKFSRSKDVLLNVDINIVLNVKFLGINIYKYMHQNNEKWKYSSNNKNSSDLKFISLSTTTNINDEMIFCNEKIELYGNEKNIFPTSYWNSSFLKRDLFSLEVYNTQDCSFFDLKVKKLADEKIYDKSLIASRYKLFGETNQGNVLDIDIWYNKTGRWVKMIFLKDGSEIKYILDEYHEK